jgi:hypothetical protein
MTEYPEDEEERDEVKIGAKEDVEKEQARQTDPVEEEAEPHITANGFNGHRQHSGKDPVTGQWTALGAPVDNGDAEYDSTTEDAMAYLNAVRAERENLPEVFTASRQVSDDHEEEEYAEDEADESDLVDGGTYIGRPSSPTPEADETDPRHVFTQSLKTRFMKQRLQLHFSVSAESVAQLGDKCPITFPQGNNKAFAEWHRIMSTKSPVPAQLRCMEQEVVFRLLALLQKSYLIKGKNIKTVTSSWLWSLLARLDDVGNMDNDQVYALRELGKKAVLLQLHFADPETAAQLEALEQQEDASPSAHGGAEIPIEDDLEAIDSNPQASFAISRTKYAKTHHAKASENTLATLDMILVVVGEIFRQRDLLAFRRPWTPAETETEAEQSVSG